MGGTSPGSLVGSGIAGEAFEVASDGFEELVGRLDPDVGARVLIPGLDPVPDVTFELRYRAVSAPADLLVGQLGEPPLDHVEP